MDVDSLYGIFFYQKKKGKNAFNRKREIERKKDKAGSADSAHFFDYFLGRKLKEWIENGNVQIKYVTTGYKKCYIAVENNKYV